MFSGKYCDNHSFKLPLIQKQVKVICMSIFATYYLGFKDWKGNTSEEVDIIFLSVL